jgi:hypothetical protein
LIVGLVIRPARVIFEVVWLVALMCPLFVFGIFPNLVVVKGLPESSGMGDDGLDGEVGAVLLDNEVLERLDEARSVVFGVHLAVRVDSKVEQAKVELIRVFVGSLASGFELV